jgi:hypothetical protein
MEDLALPHYIQIRPWIEGGNDASRRIGIGTFAEFEVVWRTRWHADDDNVFSRRVVKLTSDSQLCV